MSIPADTAARVARAHGLPLSDAAALAGLADDEAHAIQLARQFGSPTELVSPRLLNLLAEQERIGEPTVARQDARGAYDNPADYTREMTRHRVADDLAAERERLAALQAANDAGDGMSPLELADRLPRY